MLNAKNIVKRLKNDFQSSCRPASRFINKHLWNDCVDMFSDHHQIEKIIFANSLGVPPVKAVIQILIDDYDYPPNTTFNAQDARNLGSLTNFIFKDLLLYDSAQPRRTVKLCGIKEGCIFIKSGAGIPKQLPNPTNQAFNTLDIAEHNIPSLEESVSPVNKKKTDFGYW